MSLRLIESANQFLCHTTSGQSFENVLPAAACHSGQVSGLCGFGKEDSQNQESGKIFWGRARRPKASASSAVPDSIKKVHL
jgi:hypothetical protein